MRTHLSVGLSLATLFVGASPATLPAQCTPAVERLIADQKFDEARADAQAAVKRNAADDAALHCMGMVYLSMDKPGDAADWFEKAVKANDKVSAHHLWLANSLGEQAQHTNKLKLPFLARRIKGEFDRAAQLDPTSIEAHHGLIEFYSRAPGVMGGSMDKAKDEAREIEKLNAMRGHLEMAMLVGNQEKDLAGAERELKAAVAAAPPDSLAALYALGSFLVSEKRWPEAFSLYEKMLKDHPAELSPHLQYGRVAALSGENGERGIQEIRYWLANAPKDASVINLSGAHYRLGMIYDAQGKKDLARTEYQTALSLNPKNADAKKALDGLR